jgi:hypothetical protein
LFTVWWRTHYCVKYNLIQATKYSCNIFGAVMSASSTLRPQLLIMHDKKHTKHWHYNTVHITSNCYTCINNSSRHAFAAEMESYTRFTDLPAEVMQICFTHASHPNGYLRQRLVSKHVCSGHDSLEKHLKIKLSTFTFTPVETLFPFYGPAKPLTHVCALLTQSWVRH